LGAGSKTRSTGLQAKKEAATHAAPTTSKAVRIPTSLSPRTSSADPPRWQLARELGRLRLVAGLRELDVELPHELPRAGRQGPRHLDLDDDLERALAATVDARSPTTFDADHLVGLRPRGDVDGDARAVREVERELTTGRRVRERDGRARDQVEPVALEAL